MSPIDYEIAAAIVAIAGVVCVALGAMALWRGTWYSRGYRRGYERGVEAGRKQAWW